MKDYEEELRTRVNFIRKILKNSKAEGIIYGNSGGKDSALVGALCKNACVNTLGVVMPCGPKRNYEEDTRDALSVAECFGIDTITVDLTCVKNGLMDSLKESINITATAAANISPRLRMTTLYAVAASQNSIVAGTGNRSEAYMGYFTKWGDGAYDLNPIADLTVTEIYEFLRYLNAPEQIITKAPSAGLFDGQTDEDEMGITYDRIDDYLLNGNATAEDKALIEKYHKRSQHKRSNPAVY